MTCSHTLVLIELGLHILQRLNSSKQTGCVVWYVLVHLVIFKEVGLLPLQQDLCTAVDGADRISVILML